jgi:hypothetical protein
MRFTAHGREPMSGTTAVSHSVFSLRSSAFNDFLYAPIGEEKNGMVLTVLSALARLGVDPWDEAARLSELLPENARKRLTSIISGLPDGLWAKASAGDIAARLGALLPGTLAAIAQPAMPQVKQLRPAAVVMFLFLFFANALVFFVMRDHAPQPIEGPSISTSSTAVPPQVPSP